ncbi:hypothetical protein [Salinibacterium sp.]|uniref:hypothetical protein n=1 Tax=Salinibacterium sp. TaxID=1915057 RepID=UPI00286B5461|nr:hypothetical protein [Salinibacterium sp.]
MSISLKQLLRRHGAFVSGITGIAVVVFLVAQDIVRLFVNYVGISALVPADFAVQSFGYALLQAIPFGLGFFLSLWLVAPIAEELRVGHVLTRAILATGIASTVLFIVLAVLAIVDAFSSGNSLFGNSFPNPFDGDGAAQGLLRALSSAINTFIAHLPLGVLAGILLWIWRKDHPPKRPLEGIIDV